MSDICISVEDEHVLGKYRVKFEIEGDLDVQVKSWDSFTSVLFSLPPDQVKVLHDALSESLELNDQNTIMEPMEGQV